MKNIHVLPTDKPSRLCINGKNGQHIYITSDEEIKEGDWFYDLDTKYIKVKQSWENSHLDFNGKKIILTTDQDLIANGVQAIDDEFLEWFVNNKSCEKVEVESFCKNGNNCPSQGAYDKQYLCDVGYKIIIPKEEPKQEWNPTQGEQVWIKVFSNWSSGTYIGYDRTKHIHLVRENEEGGGNLLSSSKILPYKSMPNEPKQETLEEAAENHINKLYTNYAFKEVLESLFIDGAKWQAERMYSEAIEFGKWLDENTQQREYYPMSAMTMEELFEQFKKK